MKIQNWIRSGYVTYIGIALLSFVRRVSRLGSLVFPYRDYSISITLHTISFSTPNSGLYSEINDTKRFKLIVDAPFVYTVASNATTNANIRSTVPDGYIAVGLVLPCGNFGELSTRSLCHCCVVISQRCHRIASFFRLALTQISGTDFHRYFRNAVLVKVSSLHNSVLVCKKVIIPTCITAQRSWVQIK